MAANGTFTELVTTTLRNHKKGIKDNITNRNALLNRMYKKGNYRTEDGGLSIVEPLDYNSNSTYWLCLTRIFLSDSKLLAVWTTMAICGGRYRRLSTTLPLPRMSSPKRMKWRIY